MIINTYIYFTDRLHDVPTFLINSYNYIKEENKFNGDYINCRKITSDVNDWDFNC